MERLKILTWHVHGAYLYYLAQTPHDFFVPVKPARPTGYGGRCGTIAWPDNLHEVPADRVCNLDLDCVLFQSPANYLADQYEILSPDQRALPQIYLEHDPPRGHPTDTRHVVADGRVLLAHVTHFNQLMWDQGTTESRVIDHGVIVPPSVRYTGELQRGLVVVNCLQRRGRRLGADIFERVRQCVPLDLVGMESAEAGGLGELPHGEMPAFAARYRFFFNPVRYTSLGLAVCEAMSIGMPIVGLATTEMATVVQNGVSGYIDTSVDRLIEHMQRLLADPEESRRLGEGAASYARRRFGIERFTHDWNECLTIAMRKKTGGDQGGRSVVGQASKLHQEGSSCAT